MMSNMSFTLILLIGMVALGESMTLYQKTADDKFQRVLVPVSSTVIPLDDLPEFKVGAGFGYKFDKPPAGVKKPKYPIKLITAGKSKKPAYEKKKYQNAAIIIEQKNPEHDE